MERIKTNYKKIENTEKQGIELYFDTIPTTEERNILKNNGYRWNNQKKCWYIKKENITTEQKEAYEYKEIIPASPEEIEMLIKEQWKSESMQEHMRKTYNYYKLKDGHFLEFTKPSKISMHTTIWYDDETEAPDNTESNFIHYNFRMFNPARAVEHYLSERERLRNHGGATGLYDYNNIYISEHYTDNKTIVDFNFFDEKPAHFVRYLTDAEEFELIKLLDEYKENYLKRLKKYFKRYHDKIHVCGYWANR